jgi:hypothetical protein
LHRCALFDRLEKRDLRFTDLLQVSLQARHVQIGHAARDDDVVRDAVRGKGGQREVAHFDGVVDQFVVVGGDIGAKAIAPGAPLRQRRRHAPGTRRWITGPLDVDLVRSRFLAQHAQEHAGPVEEAMRLIEVGGAHGQVPCVDFIVQGQGARRWRGAPAVFIALGKGDGDAVRLGADAHDVAGEFADHVAARDPGRQGKLLPFRCRRGDRDGDVEQVAGEVGRDNRVLDSWLLRAWFFHIVRSRDVFFCSVADGKPLRQCRRQAGVFLQRIQAAHRSAAVSMSRKMPGSATLTSVPGDPRTICRAPSSPASASSAGKWASLKPTGLPR